MGKSVLRMSSSGYCPKRLSAILLGTSGEKAPPWLESSAEEGQVHEERIKNELRDLGCLVVDEQKEVFIDFPTFRLVGHIDGRIKLSGEVLDSSRFNTTFVDCHRADVDFSQFYLLEVKTFSYLELQQWLNGGFEAFPWYADQSTCYERALCVDTMVYVVKDRSSGTRRLYVIKGERGSMPEIIDRLEMVVQYTSRGQLAPATFDLDSRECRRFCAYRNALCSPDKAIVDDVEVDRAAHDYCKGRRLENEGKALVDEAKVVLVDYAKAKGLNRWVSGRYDVTYSTYPRESISIRGLEEIMPRSRFESAINVSTIERVRVIDSKGEE